MIFTAKKIRWLAAVCLGAVMLLLAGCRSSAGLLLPMDVHPEVLGQSQAAVLQGDTRRLQISLDRLRRQGGERSRLLYLLESGRLLSLAGDELASMERFAEADRVFDDALLEASLRVSDAVAQGISLATNDRALPYKGKLYERMLLQMFHAYHHLGGGDLLNARIALNKALRDLRWGTNHLEQVSRDGSGALESRGIQSGTLPSLFAGNGPVLRPVRSTDNALIYYLSGLLHQAAGEADRAAIDYRNALAMAPGSAAIEDALRSLDGIADGQARVVVIHERGWVAEKIPFSFSIFLNNRSYTLSLPYYPQLVADARHARSNVEIGVRQVQLQPLLSIDAVARRAHEEHMPFILLRQVMRMVAKQELQAEAAEASPLLGIATSLYAILSDSPDLRSWQSLPSVIDVGETTLPAGSYRLQAGIAGELAPEIHLSADAVTLIRIVSAQGKRIKVDSFALPLH
jgi:hypothetical protein